VGRHTQLDGAVIASTATADKNSLDTGTLGFSDLHNEADYKVSHTGVSLSGSGSFGDTFKGNLPGGMIAAAGSSGHAEGTTQAAVAEGSITVRDKASQQQDLANLSRDTVNANDSISPIFDKEKEQNRLKAVGLISDIGSQAADIARTQGDIYALDAAKKALGPLKANATEKERQDYVAALRNSPAYQEEMKSFGTGSNLQRGIQAATAALQGLAGGNVAGALAGASAPELAHLIKSTEDDPVVNTLAHAILGGAVAVLQGNNAAAGAMGAAAGELAAKAIMAAMYPGKSASDLNESEKQTISTLASISAGMAGGLVGDSTASAGAGAQAGKNAVENNLMGGSEDAQAAWIRQHGLDMASCSDDPDGAACQKAKNERDAVGLALATGGVALLPGGAQVMWGLGAGANAGVSYWADGTIDPANAAIAGWVNVFSMGNQLVGTVAWNAAGGALGNWIDDKDPLTGAVINGVGSGIGYGIGNGIKWGVNAGANWWKGGWDPKFNPELQKYTEIKGDFGISKEVTPSNIPGSFGDISASYSSEYGGKKLEPIIEDKLK
jgi:filamentous hemagglutinin